MPCCPAAAHHPYPPPLRTLPRLPCLLACFTQLYKEMQRRKVSENVVALTALLKAVGSTPGPGMARECTRIFRRMMRGPARCGSGLCVAGTGGTSVAEREPSGIVLAGPMQTVLLVVPRLPPMPVCPQSPLASPS